LLTDSGKNNYVCILSEKVDFAWFSKILEMFTMY
jgi:hypothetical protein